MEEEKQDVVVDSSTTEEQEVVNTEQEATPEPQSQEQAEPSTQEVKPEVRDNRPIENVTWEIKRKFDEIVPSLRNEIQELKSYIQSNQQPQQPKYTKAQLQAYASEPTTTTEQRLWAYTEVGKIEEDERHREYEKIVRSSQEQSETKTRQAQSAQWVAQNFPDMVIKDQGGNPLGWNQSHPVLMKANEYMSRSKSLQSDPEGFAAAVKMAAFDMGVTMGSNKKLDKTIGQLRKEQKKQLASAGGTRVSENPEAASKTRLAKLQEEYAKTGSQEAFKEIIKARKLNPWI